MKHNIPLGTKVSFGEIGHSNIYIVDGYYEVLGPCPPDCSHDHDCYEEPYIKVRQEIGTAFPLSKLDYIFDSPNGVGRKPTEEDLKLSE